MKKLAAVILLTVFAVLIVLPATLSVNYTLSNSLVAEGSPLPFPKPPSAHAALLIAEGSPLPFPKPPQNSFAA